MAASTFSWNMLSINFIWRTGWIVLQKNSYSSYCSCLQWSENPPFQEHWSSASKGILWKSPPAEGPQAKPEIKYVVKRWWWWAITDDGDDCDVDVDDDEWWRQPDQGSQNNSPLHEKTFRGASSASRYARPFKSESKSENENKSQKLELKRHPAMPHLLLIMQSLSQVIFTHSNCHNAAVLHLK